jgi:hypothetical protein
VKPLYAITGGFLLLGAWIVLAFVMAIPSGWVHLPLAAGVTLIAVGIIQLAPAGARE